MLVTVPGTVRGAAPAAPDVRFKVTSLQAVTESAAETEALAARLAERLAAGDVVTVSGELGAGKTTFVRGAARALGVREPVSSPTFTIGHRYDAPLPVAHLDLYRLAGIDAEEWGDLEPYFDGTVAFVEWPEHGGAWLPSARASVTLSHVDETRRRVSIESEDDLGL
jgi:tRNA threonylcarbamoyladenosine biosynthesis protein TsaE